MGWSFYLILLFSLLGVRDTIAKDFILAPKQYVRIDVDLDSEIHIEDSSIIKVRDHKDWIKVLAKKVGSSRITVSGRVHNFQVVGKRQLQTYRQLRKTLRDSPSLNVTLVKNSVKIEGVLTSIDDFSKVRAQMMPKGQFSWNLQASNSVLEELRQSINRHLKENHLPEADVALSPELQVLVPTENKGLKKRYQKVLTPLGVSVNIDPNLLFSSPLISLSILIAEIKAGSLHKIGLDWPHQLQATLLPEFGVLQDSALFQLNAVESLGYGQILAAPKLLCRSGKKAKFVSGGEIPIFTGNLGRNVVWKRHGIVLEFEPTVDTKNRLNLKIRTEISSIDASASVNGVPGIISNQITTDFTLKKPRPILISGLFKKESSSIHQGVPFIQRVPIIGVFFGSRYKNKSESELVIVVHPQILTKSDIAEHSSPEFVLEPTSVH